MKPTQLEIEKEFEAEGCKLISEYKNASSPLTYIAKCGHTTTCASIWSFRRKNSSHLCKECSPKKSYTPEQVKTYIESEGCHLVDLSIKNGYKVVTIVCQCGHEHTMTFEKFCAGQGRICPRCARPRGEKHANFNPNLSDEDRMKNRDVWENILWRNEVFSRDKYTCCVCGDARGGNLIAHHLDGWAENEDSRFDISNGVTLCSTCHKAFHSAYGYGRDTKAQFLEWRRDNTEVSA